MLYANTDDGSSALWVCDGSGVVVDNISIYGAERAPILEQINEHYGTSFTGWSDNEIGLRFGDTIPDWNAYEKIEMQHYNIAIAIGNYLFGHVDGQVYTYIANENGSGYGVNENGVIQNGMFQPPESEVYEGFIQLIKTKLSDYNVSTVQWESKSYEVGNQVENWDTYTKIV